MLTRTGKVIDLSKYKISKKSNYHIERCRLRHGHEDDVILYRMLNDDGRDNGNALETYVSRYGWMF